MLVCACKCPYVLFLRLLIRWSGVRAPGPPPFKVLIAMPLRRSRNPERGVLR